MDENKNLEELEQEVKDELSEVEKGIEEANDDEVKDVAKKVLDQAKASLLNLKAAVEGLDLNKDGVTLGQHLGKFSQQITDAINRAQEKVGYKELDEQTQQAWGQTKETITKVSDNVVKAAKDAYETVINKEKLKETWDSAAEKLSEATKEAGKNISAKGEEIYAEVAEKNPELKEAVDKVTEKAGEASAFISEKYQEFIHDEKVRAAVRTAKNNIEEFSSKVVEAFKDMFKPEEEAEEQPEENSVEE